MDGADIREGGKVVHDEVVSMSLGMYPWVLFGPEVTSNVIKELPGVREVAGVNIEALGITRLAEDRPWDTGLELEVVKGDVDQFADFVTFAEMCDDELGIMHALFRFKVKYVHATKVQGAMLDGSGCGAVDAHFGEEGGEIGSLQFLALFAGKTGRTKRVL